MADDYTLIDYVFKRVEANQSVDTIMMELFEKIGADYCFQNISVKEVISSSSRAIKCTYEWAANGSKNLLNLEKRFEDRDFLDIKRLYENDNAKLKVFVYFDSSPDMPKALMAAGVKSLLRIPLIRNEKFCGYIDFADSDIVSYTAGVDALEASEKLLSENADGTALLTNATTAYNSFRKILETKFAALAKEERTAAFNAKKKADDVRCAVAAKEEYNAAVDAFRKGDSAFVTNDPEGAYESYHTAKESFLSMADDIGVKRAAAQAAIERAKNRAQESNAVAKQADKDAPLGNATVKGIEAEDTVLLETTTFDNPEAAEADIPEEIQEAN